MNYGDLIFLFVPELVVVLTALAVLAADLVWARFLTTERRHIMAMSLCLFGGLAAVVSLMMASPDPGLQAQWLSLGGAANTVKIGLIGLTLTSLAIGLRVRFTSHIGEFYLLTMFALVGMMLMASANHLLLAFVALEMVSLSFYCLVAFDRQAHRASEAAIKYFLLGGVSAAFTLFGLSYIYGASNALSFPDIAARLADASLTPLLIVGLVAVAIGFGFKIAAAPMHLWAPDAYQTAAPPVAALIASASKLAGFYLFTRIWILALGPVMGSLAPTGLEPGWLIILAVLAAASLLVGNLTALAQTSVRRLLAYSAIAHAGYVLLGLMAGSPHGMASTVYYLITYSLAAVGVFSLATLVEQRSGNDEIGSFASFHSRYPLEAFCLLIFFLSLAGIPPLAGFFGKFYLFAAALQSATLSGVIFWLVVFAIAMSAVSLYYYLKVLKQVYVVKSSSPTTQPTRHDPVLRIVAILMALGIIVLGCFPDLLVGDLLADLR